VANAILDGTDAIMLSGETASGQFPLEAVRMMDRIARAVESSVQPSHFLRQKLHLARQQDSSHAICAAASALVEDLEVQALVAFTFSGNTARLMAQHRPTVPILAVTPNEKTYQRLCLIWGITPIRGLATDDLEALSVYIHHTLTTRGFAQPHDQVVLLGGHPLTIKGKTNFLKIARVEELLLGQQLGSEGHRS
jgi:pyruvate kinase